MISYTREQYEMRSECNSYHEPERRSRLKYYRGTVFESMKNHVDDLRRARHMMLVMKPKKM